MEQIINEIDNRFKKMADTYQKTKYVEIVNHKHTLKKEEISYLLKKRPRAANVLDKIERQEILDWFKKFDFSDDMWTRQATMQPKYQDNKDKAACISAVQVLIRNGKVYVNAFFRSQNFDNNFLYDNQTLALLANNIAKRYKKEVDKIFITVGSLHRYI